MFSAVASVSLSRSAVCSRRAVSFSFMVCVVPFLKKYTQPNRFRHSESCLLGERIGVGSFGIPMWDHLGRVARGRF